MAKVLCVGRFRPGQCLDLVLRRHDLVQHRIATLPVADMHRNSVHGRATVLENGTSIQWKTLVQGGRGAWQGICP
jgi:hypothetical protein